MNDDDILTATSPEPRYANPISHSSRNARSLWSRLSGNVMTSSTVAKTTVLRRDLSDGAIAGTVVGVVLAAALLAFCLYPVIVHQTKRRRRAGRPFDAEVGSPAQPVFGSAPDPNSHCRLSSTDSFKQNGELSRGELGGIQSKELGWVSGNADVTQTRENFKPSRQLSTRTEGDAWQHDGAALRGDAFDDDYTNESTPFPYYMPASMPDDNPGVLKGTSHDYYSPSIPSSAFGMVTTLDTVEPPRTLSRGSSFKHNVKQMFRRPSGRDTSLVSVISAEDKSTSSRAYASTGLGRILTSGHPTGSPPELSPTTTSTQAPPAPVLAASSADKASVSPSQPVITTPPQSPPHNRAASKASPSPPSDPALGTVNPMDIMPASTESEMWHRTEHQLLAASYGSSPGPSSSDQADPEDVSTFTPPPVSAPSPDEVAQAAQSSTPTNQEAFQGLLKREGPAVLTIELHSHDHLSPSMVSERNRHPSYPSDCSTPFPSAHSTGPSTENTPSTQLDSPSPGLMDSPDFRHSASPQPGRASPRVGVFRCDEPGCSQVFDQPHKLK
ncbi:hypothetical protein EsDP_00005340 [Epichloe bromicola]|uniref:Uncharacterized protein n=1 Tax=Epichloe bromicola TaxID=79588 RepID=A0ABQ0CUD4_9HYPO